MEKIIIGYDPAHAVLLKEHASEGMILTFDLELEWELERLGVPFVSANKYRTGDQVQNFALAGELMESLYRPEISFLYYRGVSLADIFSFKVQVFFQDLLYYRGPVKEAQRQTGAGEILVCPPPQEIGLLDNVLLHWEQSAALHAAKLAVGDHKARYIVPAPKAISSRWAKKSLIEIVFKIYNACMGLFPRLPLRVMVSDHWRNVAPMFEHLDCQLVMYERKEFMQIPWAKKIKHRIRFEQPKPELSLNVKSEIELEYKQMQKRWLAIRAEFMSALSGTGPLATLLCEIIDDLFVYQIKNSFEHIAHAEALLHAELPHVILLRTTLGAQAQYSILAGLGRRAGIPVIEVQHGLELFIKGTLSRRHRSEYMAVYGALVQKEMKEAQQEPKLAVVGSPRLELLHPQTVREAKYTILFIVPDVGFLLFYDTYEIQEYFNTVARAARAAEARVLIKLRPASGWQHFYRTAIANAFAGTAYGIVQDEPMEELAARAHVAVSCFSTAILDLMLLGMPVILAGFAPVEQAALHAHFDQYDKNAVRAAYTEESLQQALVELKDEGVRKRQREAGNHFLKKEFSFDGKGAERLAALVQTLAKK